jgi:hypothetical protein
MAHCWAHGSEHSAPRGSDRDHARQPFGRSSMRELLAKQRSRCGRCRELRPGDLDPLGRRRTRPVRLRRILRTRRSGMRARAELRGLESRRARTRRHRSQGHYRSHHPSGLRWGGLRPLGRRLRSDVLRAERLRRGQLRRAQPTRTGAHLFGSDRSATLVSSRRLLRRQHDRARDVRKLQSRAAGLRCRLPTRPGRSYRKPRLRFVLTHEVRASAARRVNVNSA